MPIRSALLATTIAFATLAQPALAFDPSTAFAADEEPREILRYGFRALREGKTADAMAAFRFGADEKNDVAAQWKLARMLQSGVDGEPDHRGAAALFAKIADRHGDSVPPAHTMGYVSGSLVALGLYALHGVDGAGRNARQAETHFFRAAAIYHDAEAQYQLGSLYRGGELGTANPRSAARWLSLSARKGHPYAQAELGEMLMSGEGVHRRTVRGLVMISRAADALAGSDPRIAQLQLDALDMCTETERQEAATVLAASRAIGPSPLFTRRMYGTEGFAREAAANR